jgi:hypothetical protein
VYIITPFGLKRNKDPTDESTSQSELTGWRFELIIKTLRERTIIKTQSPTVRTACLGVDGEAAQLFLVNANYSYLDQHLAILVADLADIAYTVESADLVYTVDLILVAESVYVVYTVESAELLVIVYTVELD